MPNVPLYPLPFVPYFRPMPWGGRRLRNWVSAPLPADQPIGEAWLLSDHPVHRSVVAAGPLAGVSIRELMETRAQELLGAPAARFPLLIKILDAHENLSVQVHPDDAAAKVWAPTEGGKTEAWWVLDATPQAAIYLGLKPGVDRATVERELALGTLPLLLNRHEPQKWDYYFVPAGTIHAIGSGVVLLEVQQTSDATFRLYDWGRLDAAGQPRPLHIEAGLNCLKEAHVELKPNPVPLAEGGYTLVRCPYFAINWLQMTKPTTFRGPCILVAVAGGGMFTKDQMPLDRGVAALVPAAAEPFEFCPTGPSVIAHIEIK